VDGRCSLAPRICQATGLLTAPRLHLPRPPPRALCGSLPLLDALSSPSPTHPRAVHPAYRRRPPARCPPGEEAGERVAAVGDVERRADGPRLPPHPQPRSPHRPREHDRGATILAVAARRVPDSRCFGWWRAVQQEREQGEEPAAALHDHAACSLGLSATSQQCFSLRTNQPPATSQQYSSLRTNQHQPSATSQPNRLLILAHSKHFWTGCAGTLNPPSLFFLGYLRSSLQREIKLRSSDCNYTSTPSN
jgi:hypothetical protein